MAPKKRPGFDTNPENHQAYWAWLLPLAIIIITAEIVFAKPLVLLATCIALLISYLFWELKFDINNMTRSYRYKHGFKVKEYPNQFDSRPTTHNTPKSLSRKLFRSGVMYSRAEIERIYQSPRWLQHMRKTVLRWTPFLGRRLHDCRDHQQ